MTELPLPREAYDIWASAPLRYVLVHGVGGDRTQWRALAEHLAIRAGVLAIDLAGHGAARHVLGPYRISRFCRRRRRDRLSTGAGWRRPGWPLDGRSGVSGSSA